MGLGWVGGGLGAENIWRREKFLDLSPTSASQHLLQHQGLNFGAQFHIYEALGSILSSLLIAQ